MDIRKYFGGFSHIDNKNENKKKDTSKKEKPKRNTRESSESPLPRKRKRIIISDSESEEEALPRDVKRKNDRSTRSSEDKMTVVKSKSSQATKKHPSSSSRASPRKKSSTKPPLQLAPVVSSSHYFGSNPVQRSKRKVFAGDDNDVVIINDFKEKSSNKGKKSSDVFKNENAKSDAKKESLKMPDDDLSDIDLLNDDVELMLKQVDEMSSLSSAKTSPPKADSDTNNQHQNNKDKKIDSTPSSKAKNKKATPTTPKSVEKIDVPVTPEEQRKNMAVNYKKYLERAGPQALGTKTVPEGKEGCFDGLAFVITGVLESVERDEAAEIIKKYKGRVTGSVSKKTHYLVAGRDAGPSKLDKASKCGVKVINEDELFKLIVTKSDEMKSPVALRMSPRKQNSTPKTPPSQSIKTPAKEVIPKSPRIPPKEMKPATPPPVRKPAIKTEQVSSKLIDKVSTKPETVKAKAKPETVKVKAKPIAYVDEKDVEELLWVDKYKPKSCAQLIGQQGERSNMNKLKTWLRNWHKNNNGEKKKRPPPGRFWGGGGNDDGSAFKAALLSGPPGIGKTTTANLVCKELGFSFVELNASDTRSKKNLQEVVKELLGNKSLSVLSKGDQSTSKHCLLMDEVDGMSGNEDRGGVQELIQLIKNSRIPIICMCNDRNHQKIRSLSNYCFDLRFMRPRVEQIKGAMLSLCFKEKLKVAPQALQEIIVSANQDIRQIIHHLSLWSAKDKNMTSEQVHKDAQKAKKDEKLNPFDTARKVFSAEDHKTMSIHDKSELFFFDYSLSPLFVQENYVNMNPTRAKGDPKKTLRLLSATADSICESDLIEKIIRKDGHWDLLPAQALYASIIPGELMECKVPHQVSFPSWLGKYSRRNKFLRLTQELSLHMRLKIHANPTEMNLDYIPRLRDSITKPLLRDEMNGVHEAVGVLQSYDLLRDDMESIMELSTWPGMKDAFSEVNSKVKAAFTRAYNSSGHLIPYAIASAAGRKRRAAAMDDGEGLEDDDNVSEDEKDDGIDADGMIKIKKPSSRGKAKTESASTSQGKGKGRGKKSKS